MTGSVSFSAASYKRIQLLLNLNRPLEAEEAARALLSQEPNDAQALAALGLCLLRQHLPIEACRVLYRAISADPTRAASYALLAEAQAEAKDFSAAQLNIQEAMRLAPREPSFYGLLAIAQFGQLRPEEALQTARAGLVLDPTDSNCHYIQARALAAVGKARSGILSLGAALANIPIDTATHTNLGLNYLDEGNFRAAQSHFSQALQQQPSNEVARQGMISAFKSEFWLYRFFRQLFNFAFRLVRLTGFLKLEKDIREIVLYVLNIALMGGTWVLAYYYGYFSHVRFHIVLLRMLCLTPLGLMLIAALFVLVFRASFLTLLRFNPASRPYLSGREIRLSNYAVLFLILALAGLGVYFTLHAT